MNKEMIQNAFHALIEKEVEKKRFADLVSVARNSIAAVQDNIEEYIALDIRTHLIDCGITNDNAIAISSKISDAKELLVNPSPEVKQLMSIASYIVDEMMYDDGIATSCSMIYTDAPFYLKFKDEVTKSTDIDEINSLQKKCIEIDIPAFFKDLEDIIEMGANFYLEEWINFLRRI